MISTPQEFEEGTAFELYVLETMRPAIEQHGHTNIDLRASKTNVAVGITLTENLSAGAVDQLKDTLAPLLFGAAWKVLDLLLEFALNRAGLRSAHRDWSIADKQQHALEARGDPRVLGCSHPVWATLLQVYARTVEHRHCLVHRTAKVNSTSGVLEGVDRNNQPLKPLTRDEQVALAQVSGLVARGVVGGGIPRRSEDHLKHYLNRLGVHTGLPAFEVGGVSAPVEIKLALVQEDGQFFLDMSAILERVHKTFPTVAHFDLTIDVPDGSGRHLFAQAEACPSGKSLVDLDALPSWLEYR